MTEQNETNTSTGNEDPAKAQIEILNAIQVPEPALPPEPPLDDDADGPKEARYEERIVAFVDILGFKDIVYKSKDPVNVGLINQIYGALDIRNDELADTYSMEVGLPLSHRDYEDRFHTFSDCIVVSVENNIRALGLLVYIVFRTCRRLLHAGFLSRGGIAVGSLLHQTSQPTTDGQVSRSPMVFGPAFIDAYSLESTHADGARVILQTKVRQMLEDYCDADDCPIPRLKVFFDAHISRAADGPSFVNLFADFPGNAFYKQDADVTADIEAIHHKLCLALNSTSDKPHQFRKNAMLAEEFNRVLERTAQAPRHKDLARFLIPPRILPRLNRR